MESRQIVQSDLCGVAGAVVVVDVLRAFTTAAYAFAAGAETVYLVSQVAEALQFKAAHAGTLAMGEERGKRPEGFDFSNSPVAIRRGDVAGRTLVQRTSAGTKGVLGASTANRLWAASLVCASATAAAVQAANIGDPTYVITGCSPGAPDTTGHDDRLTASLIERARLNQPLEAARTAAALHETYEAKRLRTLGTEHSDPADISYAADIDRFDFAMEVIRDDRGLRLVINTF